MFDRMLVELLQYECEVFKCTVFSMSVTYDLQLVIVSCLYGNSWSTISFVIRPMSSTEPKQSRSAYLQDLKGFVYTRGHTRGKLTNSCNQLLRQPSDIFIEGLQFLVENISFEGNGVKLLPLL